jgi:hypothetical protein
MLLLTVTSLPRATSLPHERLPDEGLEGVGGPRLRATPDLAGEPIAAGASLGPPAVRRDPVELTAPVAIVGPTLLLRQRWLPQSPSRSP